MQFFVIHLFLPMGRSIFWVVLANFRKQKLSSSLLKFFTASVVHIQLKIFTNCTQKLIMVSSYFIKKLKEIKGYNTTITTLTVWLLPCSCLYWIVNKILFVFITNFQDDYQHQLSLDLQIKKRGRSLDYHILLNYPIHQLSNVVVFFLTYFVNALCCKFIDYLDN